MLLFELLYLLNSDVRPENTKIHLATWNGIENPLDAYLAGEFDKWQSWQTKRNFERNYVVALINLPEANKWLFAGSYQSRGAIQDRKSKEYRYQLSELTSHSELNGRLVIDFSRTGRQSYLNAENWCNNLSVSEIYAERLSIAPFPGYRAVNLTWNELRLIVDQALDTWRTALSNVAGVYLITDTSSGRLYVGSASGEGGLWQRWVNYADNGHGGNRELRHLVKEKPDEFPKTFRYSILEIADVHDSEANVLARESHWKNVLMSREHGLNAN